MKILAKNIEKSFGENKVLHNASINILPGQVHAFMGENGAGKSTLMNIIVGDLPFDSGEIYFNDKKINPNKEKIKKVSFIRQELNLVNELSIYDNIFLGRMEGFLVNDEDLIKKTKKVFELLNINIDPTRKVKTLSIGEQQLVEISKGLIEDCEVLIMDEPTAALTDKEIKELFKIIRKLTSKGVAIVYISHRMKEIFEISDVVTIMRDGTFIKEYITKEVDEQEIINSMVGRDNVIKKEEFKSTKGDVVLKVNNITSEKLGYSNISFEAKEGEVLAIAGLMGSKRTEILETIFNLNKPDIGTIEFMGNNISGLSIKQTIDKGIAFVTEDRKNNGLHLDFTIEANIGMASPIQISKNGFLKQDKISNLSNYFIERLNIKCDTSKQTVGSLSGGNQQKVVIAKWLSTMPKLLILDEPTRGIDINAKHEIYALIEKLKSEKITILLVSSEMSETLLLADRIITLNEGKQTATVDNKDLTEELLLDLMIGGNSNE